MINFDAMRQQTYDRHQQLIADAARRRLLSSARQGPDNPATAWHWRVRIAIVLRRMADRLEPVADRPQVAMLRAVAHREISVDQALRLLEADNGHRSAIV
jgi:hypothetical protein